MGSLAATKARVGASRNNLAMGLTRLPLILVNTLMRPSCHERVRSSRLCHFAIEFRKTFKRQVWGR